MSASHNVIECKHVNKDFYLFNNNNFWRMLIKKKGIKQFNVLNDITLDVPKGSFIGLLGRNGAGKSTLLRTIGGVYNHNQGIINLSGKHSAIYELGVSGGLLLTGRAFANRWFNLGCIGALEKKRLMQNVLEFSELGSFFDKPIYSYSSGMRARLYFSVATAQPGKIYLLDEVLAVGDVYFQAKCWRRLREYFAGGSSGILVTHDWSAVLKLCEKAYVLDKGKIIDSGESRFVVQRYLGKTQTQETTDEGFSETLPQKINALTHQDFSVELPVTLKKSGKISFGYSIETFECGLGWEHLLHLDPKDIGEHTEGEYKIVLNIPCLPLTHGEYTLNLFLLRDGKPLDVRSWSSKKSCPILRVESGLKQKQGLTILPISQKISEAI